MRHRLLSSQMAKGGWKGSRTHHLCHWKYSKQSCCIPLLNSLDLPATVWNSHENNIQLVTGMYVFSASLIRSCLANWREGNFGKYIWINFCSVLIQWVVHKQIVPLIQKDYLCEYITGMAVVDTWLLVFFWHPGWLSTLIDREFALNKYLSTTKNLLEIFCYTGFAIEVNNLCMLIAFLLNCINY